MGRLLVCNDKIWGSELRDTFTFTGLVSNYSDREIVVYRKRYVENDNFFCDGDRLVACVGTWSYKSQVGQKALKILFEDVFKNKYDIPAIRKEMVGTYCIAIKDASYVKLFVDETHTYAMYYYCNPEGKFIVTNTYYHIERCVKEELDTEVFKVVAAKRGLSSNRTIYKKIYRVWENEYIEINLKENKVCVKKCNLNTKKYRFESIEHSIKVLSETIEECGKSIFSNASEKLLFATGGADSRLKLALDQYLNKTVNLAYWGGDNVITNGTIEDRKVNCKLAEVNGLHTIFFDVSEDFSDSIKDITIGECDKYGEYVTIYAHNKKWLHLFDEIHALYPNISEIELGYDPDVLREVGTIDATYKNPYSIRDLVSSSFLRSGLFKRLFDDEKVKDLIIKDIHSQIEDVDIDNLTIEEAINIFNYSRLDMGCIISNLCNEYYYSCNLLYCKPILDIIVSIPYEYKIDSKLAVKLINRWNPNLLNIPIFSQNHYMSYDRTLQCIKKTKRHAILSWLKPKVMDSLIYDLIYVNWLQSKIFPESNGNNELFDVCIGYLEKSELLKKKNIYLKGNISCKGFDLAALAWFVAFLKLCETMEECN